MNFSFKERKNMKENQQGGVSESCWSPCPLVGHCLGFTSAGCPLLEWISCFLGDSFCSMARPRHHGGSPSSCEGFSSVPGGGSAVSGFQGNWQI